MGNVTYLSITFYGYIIYELHIWSICVKKIYMPFIVGAECANTIPIPISMYIRRLITSNTVPDIQFTLGVHYKCRWLDLSI